MRFMLIQTYGRGDDDAVPIAERSPGDVAAHIEFQEALNDELSRLGELVDAQGLPAPDVPKFVVWDGESDPRERDHLQLRRARLRATDAGT